MSVPDARRGRRRLPSPFHSLGTLRVLNVLAVGSSLAAATGAVFGRLVQPFSDDVFAAVTALPTLFFGLVWAAVLRHRGTLANSNIRWGWIASIPLAMANSATAMGVLLVLDEYSRGASYLAFLGGAAIGATIGAVVWVPALVVTLLCFGVPIAWAQRLAQKGLAGEERGEIIVGSVSAAMGLGAFALFVGRHETAAFRRGLYPAWVTTWTSTSYALVVALALIGAAAGLIATLFALRRERARRAFVRQVEAGAVEGFRVEASADGKVLVRVSSVGEGYRVASIDEPLFELAETGEAQRALLARD